MNTTTNKWILVLMSALLLGGCAKIEELKGQATEQAAENATEGIETVDPEELLQSDSTNLDVICSDDPLAVYEWGVEYLMFRVFPESADLTDEAIQAGITEFALQGDRIEMDDPGYWSDDPSAAGRASMKGTYWADWTGRDGIEIRIDRLFDEQQFCSAEWVVNDGEDVEDCSLEQDRCHREAAATFRIYASNPGGGNPYSYAFDGVFREEGGEWWLEGVFYLELVQGELLPTLEMSMPRTH